MQVAALTNLRSLVLEDINYSTASMASLTRLSALQHATFSGCMIPGSLPQLTGLQVLQFCCPPYQSDTSAQSCTLAASLQQLTQLMGLWLAEMPAEIGWSSFAALNRLQWLYVDVWGSMEDDFDSELPGGPWQRSLRHLVTNSPLLCPQFLSGAEQLQRLDFTDSDGLYDGFEDDPDWDAFLCWAAQHETLRHIGYAGRKGEDMRKAVKRLKAQRPGLCIKSRRFHSTLLARLLLAEWND